MSWTLSAVSYVFFVFVGLCYTLGFWIPLHFNILEFISPVDIIKAATYPIIPAAIGILFWVVVDTVNSQERKKVEDNDPVLIKLLYYIMLICMVILILSNIFNLCFYLYKIFISEPEKRLSFILPILSLLSK